MKPFAVFALSLLLGCTVTPRIVRPAAPSLDGGIANSGIIQPLSNNCFQVTPLFYERYATLVKLYGDKLLPPMSAPRWIEPMGTNYMITSDGIRAFSELDFYYRQHFTP